MNKIEYNRLYRKTHKGCYKNWLTKTYGRMKRDNKNKFNLDLPFSKEEFSNWVKTKNIYELLENYKNSGFNKNLNPSIDRIDDYKSYYLENLQLITWQENNLKGRLSKKNKEQCSNMAKKIWSKKVSQRDLDGNIIQIFESVHEVERQLGYDASLIARACRLNKISKGYRWKYE